MKHVKRQWQLKYRADEKEHSYVYEVTVKNTKDIIYMDDNEGIIEDIRKYIPKSIMAKYSAKYGIVSFWPINTLTI